MESDYLTVKEVMTLTRLSETAVRARIYRGEIKAIKPGLRIMVHKDEVERYLQSTVILLKAKA